MKTPENFDIRPASVEDVPIILQLIRDLATYERAPHEVTATEEQLIDVLFGQRPSAEVERRGKGYGRALLIELAKIARDRSCGRMEWAVLDWNEPAIKFYHALGAKPMDEWTVFRLTRDGIARLANSE